MGEHRIPLIILLILCFAISSLPLVRASLEMWSQTYGGEYDDFAYSLVKTSDGGYALGGKTKVAYGGYTDFWLVKTDVNEISEFPSWIILPLVSTILLVVMTVSIFGQSQKATLTDGKIICGQDML